MIRGLLVFSLLTATMVGHAQEYLFEVMPTGFSTNSGVSDVTEVSNGNALFLIQNSDDFAAIEIGAAGNVVQALDFTEGNNNDMDQIAAMSDGKVLQFGHYGYTRRAGFVVRDSVGTVLKDTFLRESSWVGAITYLYDAVADNEDNIYFVGHVYDIYSGGVSFYSWRIPFVGKLNSDLEMQWVKTFSSHNSSNKRKGSANSITFDADSNLLVFGAHSHSNSSTTKRDYIAKVSPSGTTIWAKEFYPPSGGFLSPEIIRSFTDGSFCTMKSVSGGASISKFNSNGSFVWNRTFSHASYNLNIEDMDVGESGTIYLVGSLFTSLNQGVIVRLDSTGTLLNASKTDLSASSSTKFSSLMVMSDNFLTIGGQVGGVPIVMRTNSTAFGACNADSLSLDVDTNSESWTTSDNLSGKGMTYYNYSFSNDTNLAYITDTNCYIPPACDVNGSFTINDSVLCDGESLTVQSNSTGTGLNVYWLLNSNMVTGNNIDTVLPVGSHSLIQISDGSYCNDTVAVNIDVYPTYNSNIVQGLCDGDTAVVGSELITSDTIFTDTALSVSGCDSITTYQFSFDGPYTELYDTLCYLDTLMFGGELVYSSGVYFDTLPGAGGCDSIVELNLFVRSFSGSSTVESVCDSYTWQANAMTYTSSGIYVDTLTNMHGCDSVVTLDLTVLYSNGSASSMTACDSYLWPATNLSYTISGNYTVTLTNSAGCDSVASLVLTILNSSASTENVTVCESYLWAANNQTYTASGNYTVTLTNSAGCDSVTSLNLTINETTYGSESIVACDSFHWATNGETYYSSGTHLDTLTNSEGCDSIVTLNLTVNYSTSSMQIETACDTFIWSTNNMIYTQTGMYVDTLVNAVGCDSVVTLDLTILSSTSDFYALTVCDSLFWSASDETYYQSGVYIDTLVNAVGCDSVVTLDLTVNSSTSSEEIITVCDAYLWMTNDSVYEESGVYIDTLVNAIGCDSVVTLMLTVLNSSSSFDTVVTCDSLQWSANNNMLTESGTYVDTLTNAVGCDSIVYLQLTIMHSTSGTEVTTACDNYWWSATSEVYSESGVYLDTLVNSVGCDSFATLDLTILSSTNAVESAVACDAYTWPLNGEIYTETGSYVDTITNSMGCDSVVELQLTINTVDDVSLTLNGTTIIANNAQGTYRWMDCASGYAILFGETSQTFVATSNGEYAVEITQDGCVDTSACAVINSVGVSAADQLNVKIYPNPNNGQFTLNVGDQVMDEVVLLNAGGQEVMQKSMVTGVEEFNTKLSAGLYFLQLRSGTQMVYKRVLVQP